MSPCGVVVRYVVFRFRRCAENRRLIVNASLCQKVAVWERRNGLPKCLALIPRKRRERIGRCKHLQVATVQLRTFSEVTDGFNLIRPDDDGFVAALDPFSFILTCRYTESV